jgi:hypothetical protein
MLTPRRACFALRGHSVLSCAGHGLDKLHAAEAGSRPILINCNTPDWFEAQVSEDLPAMIAVDLTLIPLRGSFGVREPHDRIAPASACNRLSKAINLWLPGDKCQRELNIVHILQVAKNGDAVERRELRLEALRWVEHDDAAMVFEIEFFKRG